MGFCIDCQFWDRWRERSDGAGECRSALEIGPIYSVAANELSCFVVVSDDSGLEVQILTGPQFGCVRFKSNEAYSDEDQDETEDEDA